MTDNFESLLDFNQKFDPVLFDELVSKTKSNDSSAVIVLTKFKNDENNFVAIESILNECKLPESHLIALKILESLINKHYFTFSQEVRNSFEQTILKFVQEKALKRDVLLNKFNQVFIKLILANHYRKKSTIIANLIEYSQSDINQVINLFSILRLLIQEILTMPHPQTISNMFIENLKQDAAIICTFCNTVLEKGQSMESQLINNTLIFLNSFFELISSNLEIRVDLDTTTALSASILNLLQSEHTTRSLKAIYTLIKYNNKVDQQQEQLIGSRTSNSINDKIVETFLDFLQMYYTKFNMSKKIFFDSYKSMSDSEKEFLLDSAHLLAILSENVASGSTSKSFESSLATYSLLFAGLPDLNIFKILLCAIPQDLTAFQLVLHRFPRPSEVLITELDGEIIREKITGTEAIQFGADMTDWLFKYIQSNPGSSELIINLIHTIDTKGDSQIENDFSDTLKKSSASTNHVFTFNHKLLNSLCWSIGSVNPLLRDPDELFVAILKDLLTLCEYKQKKEEKAIIASGIMFIVGKHHSFLKNNKKFLATVFYKLFEFCDEKYEGIKDMACETFYMICEKLNYSDFKSKLFGGSDNDNLMYQIITRLPVYITPLMPYQQRIIFEGILLIIKEKELFHKLEFAMSGNDPVYTIRFKSMLVERYLLENGDDEFVTDMNVKIMTTTQYCPDKYLNQVKDAIIEHFKNFFSNVNQSEKYLIELFQFYSHFSTEKNILSTLSAYFENIYNSQARAEGVESPFLQLPDGITQNLIEIIREHMQSENVSLDWLKLVSFSFNNLILQTLVNDSNVFMEKIMSSLTSSVHEEIETGLFLLNRIYSLVKQHTLIFFLNQYNNDVIENLIGLICDKDKEYVFSQICLLLKSILEISNPTETTQKLNELISTLPNLNNYGEIFVPQLVKMRNDEQFIAALNDFRMYSWTYYENEYSAAETELATWRLSKE